MVVLGMELARVDPEIGIHIGDPQSTTLQQDQGIHRLVMGSPKDACHHVDDLTQVHRADARRLGLVSQVSFDVDRSRLIEQEGDDRLGVEDGQRVPLGRSVLRRSSARVRRRASSDALCSSFLRSMPRAAPIGSDGRGR